MRTCFAGDKLARLVSPLATAPAFGYNGPAIVEHTERRPGHERDAH